MGQINNIIPILRELAGCWANIDSILRESMEIMVPIPHSQGSKIAQKSLTVAQKCSKSLTIAHNRPKTLKIAQICLFYIKITSSGVDRWVQSSNIIPILREQLTHIQYQYLESCKSIFLPTLNYDPRVVSSHTPVGKHSKTHGRTVIASVLFGLGWVVSSCTIVGEHSRITGIQL